MRRTLVNIGAICWLWVLTRSNAQFANVRISGVSTSCCHQLDDKYRHDCRYLTLSISIECLKGERNLGINHQSPQGGALGQARRVQLTIRQLSTISIFSSIDQLFTISQFSLANYYASLINDQLLTITLW